MKQPKEPASAHPVMMDHANAQFAMRAIQNKNGNLDVISFDQVSESSSAHNTTGHPTVNTSHQIETEE